MTDQDVTVYGLKTCDSCRKAVQQLKQAGRQVELVDIRATPLEADRLSAWLAQFGAALVNTRSTTWRGLNAEERAASPLDLLRTYPTLMKRPVICAGGAAYLGWSAAVRAALLPET